MHLSLRNRILLPAVALVSAVTIILSLASFSISRTALDESFDAHLKYISASALSQIESWIGGQRNNISLWAGQPHVLAALRTGPAATAAQRVVSDELANAFKTLGFYSNLQLADANGDAVSCSNLDSVGKLNLADRQYFKDAMAGKTVVSAVLKNKLTGTPIVVLAAPVMDGPTVRGVLSASLDLNWVSVNVIEKIKILKSGYTFLYDEQGVFLSHPKKAMILNSKLSDFPWSGPLREQAAGRVRVQEQRNPALGSGHKRARRRGARAELPHGTPRFSARARRDHRGCRRDVFDGAVGVPADPADGRRT